MKMPLPSIVLLLLTMLSISDAARNLRRRRWFRTPETVDEAPPPQPEPTEEVVPNVEDQSMSLSMSM
eukprot:CAMPEP_0117035480 /NCGR_PEP_ID=MMETSP0472-20121206/25192_1 /TAXON_ID=693140 ORGANISM="Tiarina fusus, Strain LIS" /NCGR_SAMPLE_ID=MMETSP0472 /ASSEMBLY_ACC=CAM_ASM_000603 /LENGTH=66 /DNA_ID=CAMNT_0004744955 /DNA_START=147 /DNA_END=347 /DNA_ORIENTATION=+